MNENDNCDVLTPSAQKTIEFLKFYKEYAINSSTFKNVNPNEELYQKIANLSLDYHPIDYGCIIDIKKKLVRIEYPGNVKNLDKAIQTLGGMDTIEACVANPKEKLGLYFHVKNKYNKSCIADRNHKIGILIKVRRKNQSNESLSNDNIEYEVIGGSILNFIFNRLCDFQCLPLVAEHPETSLSKPQYIYNKIIPDTFPDNDWITSEESKDMPLFILPVRFSHHDSSHSKFNPEQNKSEIEATASRIKKQKRIRKIFGKSKQQLSIFVSFKDDHIPTKPFDAVFKQIHNRCLEYKVDQVKQLFEERPIWTKAAVQYNTGITYEQSRIVLAAVGYYFVTGPWRGCWVKYGYDPRKDPQAKIYQTLDYRVRTGENVQLKVMSRNNKSLLYLGPSNVEKISLKDKINSSFKSDLNERCYVLRPDTLPPARQMFYQICDLLIPEIQEMLIYQNRKNKSICDSKYGWLDKTFMNNVRDIVNNCVMKAVQAKILIDEENLQEKVSKQEAKKLKPKTSKQYCNLMLENIKKGIYKNVNLLKPGTSKDTNPGLDDSELISLSSDDEEYALGNIIKSAIPENYILEEESEVTDSEDSNLSSTTDEVEIDLEAVQEINEMISGFNKTTK